MNCTALATREPQHRQTFLFQDRASGLPELLKLVVMFPHRCAGVFVVALRLGVGGGAIHYRPHQRGWVFPRGIYEVILNGWVGE